MRWRAPSSLAGHPHNPPHAGPPSPFPSAPAYRLNGRPFRSAQQEYLAMVARVEIAFSIYAIVCAFLLRKFWLRRQLVLSMRWQVADRKAAEAHLRPQFVGTLKVDPVTGEPTLWSSDIRRKLK